MTLLGKNQIRMEPNLTAVNDDAVICIKKCLIYPKIRERINSVTDDDVRFVSPGNSIACSCACPVPVGDCRLPLPCHKRNQNSSR